MRRWIYIAGFFAMALLLGVLALKVSHRPVPGYLFNALGIATVLFVSMLLYTLLQKRKR